MSFFSIYNQLTLKNQNFDFMTSSDFILFPMFQLNCTSLQNYQDQYYNKNFKTKLKQKNFQFFNKSKKLMNITKQSTQKRMLTRPNQINSPRLAKIASRSPNTININSPNQKPIKNIFKSFELPKHQQIQFTQSVKHIQDYEHTQQNLNENLKKQSIKFSNSDFYQGSIKNNKFFGKGTYYFTSEQLEYTGEFYENYMHGWGVLKKKANNKEILVYEGNLVMNKKQGQGKYLYEGDNHYYNGEWKQDLKQGKGIYFFKEGFYNGQWEKNLMNGKGTLKFSNGNQYQGEFENGNFVKGLIKFTNGDEYSGTLINGQRNGQGTYFTLKTQQRYKGQWMNDKRHGRGTLILQNGDEFQSNFIQGQIDQTQSCTYKWNTGPDAGSVFNGWFKDGNPEKGHITKSTGQQFDIY